MRPLKNYNRLKAVVAVNAVVAAEAVMEKKAAVKMTAKVVAAVVDLLLKGSKQMLEIY